MKNIILMPMALIALYFIVFVLWKQTCYFIWLVKEAFKFKIAWQVEMVQCCMVLVVALFLTWLMCMDIMFILGGGWCLNS